MSVYFLTSPPDWQVAIYLVVREYREEGLPVPRITILRQSFDKARARTRTRIIRTDSHTLFLSLFQPWFVAQRHDASHTRHLVVPNLADRPGIGSETGIEC